MSIFIYARVSSKIQREGVGLESQIQQMKQYISEQVFCDTNQINEPITEVGSASHPEKLKKLNNLIEHVSQLSKSVIVVHAYDRFSRNVCWALIQIQKLKNANCTVVSITEPLNYSIPSGYHQLVTIFNNAELDSRNKGKKVKDAITYKKSLGGFTGKAPFGFKLINDEEQKIKKLAVNETEQIVINIIKGMRDTTFTVESWRNFVFPILNEKYKEDIEFDYDEKGNVKEPGFGNIADILNDYNITNRGKDWSEIAVRNIYHNLARRDELLKECICIVDGIDSIRFHYYDDEGIEIEEKYNEQSETEMEEQKEIIIPLQKKTRKQIKSSLISTQNDEEPFILLDETDDEDVPFLQARSVPQLRKRRRIE